MTVLHAIFGSKDHVEWWQECARAALILIYGLVLVRFAGRRIFGKWSALDIVVSVIVGSSLSRALTGSAPLWGTLAAMIVLMALHGLLAKLAAYWPAFSRIVEGRPIDIARDGKVIEPQRRWHSLSDADVSEALHRKGLEDVGQTRQITLEPSGTLSIFER
jgi:uncharacterized membrane protein YcaP (DUF421 family)